MALKRALRQTSLRGVVLGLVLLLAMNCRAVAAGLPQQGQGTDSGPGRTKLPPHLDDNRDLPELMGAKQRKEVLHADLNKSKRDASELAALARQLQAELNKPNATSLSVESLNRIERSEKLAKKIREEIKGF
jgi:hypothetical protein